MKATRTFLGLLLQLSYSLIPLRGIQAREDHGYGSYSNPNLAYSHYYAETSDVLQDLSRFRALYVTYHNCAWSAIYQNNDNQHNRLLRDDNKQDGRQCGQRGGDGDGNWYRGMGECYGANVAYSLYGVLDDDRLISMARPCGRQTYINSFYTTDGLTNFAELSNGDVDVSSVSQTCTTLDDGHTSTLGCSESGKFVIDEFNGNGCQGAYYDKTVDTLDTLNLGLSKHVHCKLIYHNEGVDYATELLSNSMPCSTRGYHKNYCPDPYHLLQVYEYNFARAQQNPKYSVVNDSPLELHRIIREVSGVLLIGAGCVLLGLTLRKWMRTRQIRRHERQAEMVVLSDGGMFT